MKKIIHIDMDAFYASVEQRDNPNLIGKPVIVGGKPDSRSVVAACSYEARAFGIHSAMACSQAQRLCAEAVFVPPRFTVYKEVSQKIHKVFAQFTSIIEPLSLDEAYLDVTESDVFDGSATLIAKEIKRRIFEATGLIASAGVAYNKFLAKIASDMDKPDGLYVILPEQGEAFVSELLVGKIFGVGPVTEKKMHALGIYKGSDLRSMTLEDLNYCFGSSGKYYYNLARGIDHRAVQSTRKRKSIGSETTFDKDLTDVDAMLGVLADLAKEVAQVLNQRSFRASTLTVKVKFANFEQVTRSYSSLDGFTEPEGIIACLPMLMAKTDASTRAVRLLGVSVSGLSHGRGMQQLPLF